MLRRQSIAHLSRIRYNCRNHTYVMKEGAAVEKDDLVYICSLVGNLSGIPARVYEDGAPVHTVSMAALPADPVCLALKELTAIGTHVGFHVTKRFFYYGVVVSGAHRIVLGPSRQAPPSDQELREAAFEMELPPEDTEGFIAGMRQIARMPLESLMQLLCAVNFMVNGEKLTLNDLVGSGENVFGLEEARAQERMAEKAPDPEALHNSLAVEQTVMNIIRKGDTAALENFARNAPAVRPGMMSRDQLRQARNTFIVTAAEASRAAIRGGMDAEDALTACDSYIRQCEMITDIQRITQLNYDMVLFYTRQVQRVRHGHYPTELVMNVANYVQHHLSEPITTAGIADSLFLSRQHLSRRFTREAGVPLAEFVRNEKTEEAKRLLRYTDRSVSAIALYLGFSSQGHFARVFKDLTGLTPGEYRDKKH